MAQETEACKCIVVVKVRGEVSAQREARETNMMLGLSHTNHAVIIDSRPAYLGMLQRAPHALEGSCQRGQLVAAAQIERVREVPSLQRLNA